jgi:hypothetical protein
MFVPARLAVGELEAGSQQEIKLTVRNYSGQDVRLFGGNLSCPSCASIAELPLTVPDGDHRDLTVRLSVPQHPGPFVLEIMLLSDCKSNPFLKTSVTGSVKEG